MVVLEVNYVVIRYEIMTTQLNGRITKLINYNIYEYNFKQIL